MDIGAKVQQTITRHGRVVAFDGTRVLIRWMPPLKEAEWIELPSSGEEVVAVEKNESGQVSGAVIWVVGVLIAVALVIWILPHLH